MWSYDYDVGWYAAELGSYEEAEQMNRRALDGREQVLGKEHPYTLTSVSNLALVLHSQGKYEEAEQMNRRALDGREQWLDFEHPDTLTSVDNLAEVLGDQEKYEAAEELHRRALQGSEKVLEVEHPGMPIVVSHEAGSEKDSAISSNLSEVSSVQSLPSLMSDSSLVSIWDQYGSKAAEHLAALLSEDSAFASMYETAMDRFSRERFHQNHDQLLKAFFKDLRSETQNSIQLATVRGLRGRDQRYGITLLIQKNFEPSNINKQQVMTMLKDQEPDRKQRLNDYLVERTSAPQTDSRINLLNDLRQPKNTPLAQDEELLDEETNSDSSDNNETR